MQGFLSEIQGEEESVPVYGDNQSTIHLVKIPMFHERYKHIDIKMHVIRDVVGNGQVIVRKVATEYKPSDTLTKVLPGPEFKLRMGLVQVFDPGHQRLNHL